VSIEAIVGSRGSCKLLVMGAPYDWRCALVEPYNRRAFLTSLTCGPAKHVVERCSNVPLHNRVGPAGVAIRLSLRRSEQLAHDQQRSKKRHDLQICIPEASKKSRNLLQVNLRDTRAVRDRIMRLMNRLVEGNNRTPGPASSYHGH
jgi:hypothetical protein